MSNLPYRQDPIVIDGVATNEFRGFLESLLVGLPFSSAVDGDTVELNTFVVMTNAAPAAITLPAGENQDRIVIKRTNAQVTINGSIDNAASLVLSSANQSTNLIYDQSNQQWWSY